MPTLDWIGKNKVISHHQDVPYRVLVRQYSFDKNGKHEKDNGSENMIIHGDNLEALKSLLPRFEGKVKCIYIDPPYNTGNEGWSYNDNVNDPRIKKWLGEVVGKEGEDLSRHDKWLCMMYPRLRLLQKLLQEDGCMAISIGYHELHNLVAICKEIFASRQVVTVTVQTSGGKPSAGFNYTHEYLVFIVPKEFSPNSLSFSGGNSRTPFEGLTLSTFNKEQRPNQVYPIFIETETGKLHSVGKSLQELVDNNEYEGELADYKYECATIPEGTVAVWPYTTPKGKSKAKECVWRHISSRLLADWSKGYIKVSPNRAKEAKNKYSIQYLPKGVIEKVESGELSVIGKEGDTPTLRFGENKTVGGQIPTIWNEKGFYTVEGTSTLQDIFPESTKVFDYPKPVELVMSVFQALTCGDDIVLDSFAGSGTSGHAVLSLNKTDNGNRRFILIELCDYADSITAERVKRVITGHGEGDNKVEGTDGDFSFYELGEPLLTPEGNLNGAVGLESIREYLWYMETRSELPSRGNSNPYYLGKHGGCAYYFYYERDSVTTLNYDFLASISEQAESFVVYADRCALSKAEMQRFNLTYKKIPRDIAKL